MVRFISAHINSNTIITINGMFHRQDMEKEIIKQGQNQMVSIIVDDLSNEEESDNKKESAEPKIEKRNKVIQITIPAGNKEFSEDFIDKLAAKVREIQDEHEKENKKSIVIDKGPGSISSSLTGFYSSSSSSISSSCSSLKPVFISSSSSSNSSINLSASSYPASLIKPITNLPLNVSKRKELDEASNSK